MEELVSTPATFGRKQWIFLSFLCIINFMFGASISLQPPLYPLEVCQYLSKTYYVLLYYEWVKIWHFLIYRRPRRAYLHQCMEPYWASSILPALFSTQLSAFICTSNIRKYLQYQMHNLNVDLPTNFFN